MSTFQALDLKLAFDSVDRKRSLDTAPMAVGSGQSSANEGEASLVALRAGAADPLYICRIEGKCSWTVAGVPLMVAGMTSAG